MSVMRAVFDREIRLKALIDVLTPADREEIERLSILNPTQLGQFHETLTALAARSRISSEEADDLRAHLEEWTALPLLERLAILDTIRSLVDSQ